MTNCEVIGMYFLLNMKDSSVVFWVFISMHTRFQSEAYNCFFFSFLVYYTQCYGICFSWNRIWTISDYVKFFLVARMHSRKILLLNWAIRSIYILSAKTLTHLLPNRQTNKLLNYWSFSIIIKHSIASTK